MHNDDIANLLFSIRWHVKNLRLEIWTMANELDTLTAQVASNTTVIESALTLINGFAARLDAAIASGGPALTNLSASLKAEDDKLAAAIVANTTSGGGTVGNPPALSAADQAIKESARVAAVAAGASSYSWTDTAGVGHNEQVGSPTSGVSPADQAKKDGAQAAAVAAGLVAYSWIDTAGVTHQETVVPGTPLSAADQSTKDAASAAAVANGQASFSWTDSAGVKHSETVSASLRSRTTRR